jgi:hypothetical protein
LATVTARGSVTNTNLSLTGQNTISRVFIDRANRVASGISWYSSGYTSWATYMGPAGTANQGPTGNITPPSGTLVTSWAIRNFIENVSGYGWTWESGTATGQPSIVAELSSETGNFRTIGTISASNFSGSSSGTNTGDQTTITGNAGSATTLQTARTLTIGSTGKTFNGSANVSWSLAEIGAFASGAANSVDVRLASGDGRGLRFWDSDAYKIWMSASTNTTWGGRISGETTSDYNMYFRIGAGTNRGFVFENVYATKLLSINPDGVRTGLTVTAPTFSGALSGNATSATSANQLQRYGIIYGDNWNTYTVSNRLIASSFHNATGTNKPPTYDYGSMISFGNSGADQFQIAIPENQNSAVGKFNSMHYRSGWNGAWSSWRQVLDFTDGLCAIDAPGDVTTRVYSSASGYNTPFSSKLEIWGQVDDWAWGKFRFHVRDEAGTQPVYGAQLRVERYSKNVGWEMIGMVPRNSQDLEWQGQIIWGLSDSRVKENVVSLSKGIESVKSMNPVSFDWKPVENINYKDGHDIGFIAQEIEQIIPEVVHTREDGYKTVRYEKIVPVLAQAIKEQQDVIEKLIERINILESK